MPNPNNTGYKVTFRNYSLEEMVAREWGSSFAAPDHGVYAWSNGRKFDSTDLGFTGIYGPRTPGNIPIVIPGNDLITESGAYLITEGGDNLVWA